MCSSRPHPVVDPCPWVRTDGGDLNTIMKNRDARQQKLYLHACLVQKCTVGALRRDCEIIIAVQGNPKIKVLWKEMKSMLGGT